MVKAPVFFFWGGEGILCFRLDKLFVSMESKGSN